MKIIKQGVVVKSVYHNNSRTVFNIHNTVRKEGYSILVEGELKCENNVWLDNCVRDADITPLRVK